MIHLRKYALLVYASILLTAISCNAGNTSRYNEKKYYDTAVPWFLEVLADSAFKPSDSDIFLSDRLLSNNPRVHDAAVMELQKMGVDGIRVLFLWSNRYEAEFCSKFRKELSGHPDVPIVGGMDAYAADLNKYMKYWDTNILPIILSYDKDESITLTHYFHDSNKAVKGFTINACETIRIDPSILATALINSLDAPVTYYSCTDIPLSANESALLMLPHDELLRGLLFNFINNKNEPIRTNCGSLLSEYMGSNPLWKFVDNVTSAGESGDYVQEFITLLNNETDNQNKCIYLEVLSSFEPEERIINVLIAALEGPTLEIREAAIRGLSDYGLAAKDALPILEEVKFADGHRIRIIIDSAVRKIKDEPYPTF